MSKSEIPDFPDVNVVARILLENRKFVAANVSDLKNNPEFQVFRIIGQNKIIDTEKIESKFESQSLSMILSNLQADNLIEQTSDYKWKVAGNVLDLLLTRKEEVIQQEEEEIEQAKHLEQLKARNAKKALYKKIADQLVDPGYVPPQHTVEDLFQIPEVEILTIIYENNAIEADAIDKKTTLDSSVSLALSNLSADGIIRQNESYQWELSDTMKQELNQLDTTMSSGEQQGGSDPTSSLEYDVHQGKIIEHKQLLKAVLDINYFDNKTINEILKTPEFEILNIINSNSPVASEEIEEKLTQETLLSLIISNLSADGLISQTNDYRYVLAEDFRIRVSKVKVSRQEIMHQMKLEQNQSSDTSGVDVRPSDVETEEVISTEDTKKVIQPSISMNDPIAIELKKQGYIPSDNLSRQELSKVPEYEILKLLSARQPLSSDELEESASITSVSLTLSNLAADGLIRQREEDFKYELTEILGANVSKTEKDAISKTPVESSISSQPEEPEDKSSPVSSTPQMSHSKKSSDQDIEKLKLACQKAGYIDNKDLPVEELLNNPEFEILKIIGENQPTTEETLKEKAESVSPVLISRSLSKLEAENRISRNSDGTWSYSDAFETLLIEDELLEKERLAKLEADRKEQQRMAREKEEKARREKFIQVLQAEGIIEDESDEKLMQVPEFEIMWIISDADDGISEEDIKSKAKSTSPVMVTRTLGQLESKGRIQRTLGGQFELSPDLKDLT